MHDVQLLGGDDLTVYNPHIGYGDLGFSFNPIKHIKSVAHVAAKVGSGAVNVGKKVGGTALKVAVLPAYYVTKYAADLALRPVRSRINTLVSRRANKIAFDRRRSKTPTAAEHNEARNWAKAKFKSAGPHGHLLALLAGPTLTGQLGDFGVAPAVVAAAVPVLTTIVTGLIKKYAGSGEAPETPGEAAQQIVARTAQNLLPQPVVTPTPDTTNIQVDTSPSAPAVDVAPMPAAADDTATAPIEGPLGAPPEGTAAIVLMILGLAAVGTGGYLAFKR